MTIKIEIVADNADALAGKLHEFVQTFVALAKGSDPAPAVLNGHAPAPASEDEPPKRKRKTAPVIDATVEAPKTTKAEKGAKKVTPDQVRAILNKLRTDHGNDALGEVVTQFAPKFSEVPESSYPALYAAAEKYIADAAADDEDED
jgi:hypothetical protein